MRGTLGFALVLVTGGAALVIGGAMIAMFDPAVESLLESAHDNTDSDDADSGIGWMSTAWGAAPFVITGLLVLMLIAAAAARGGR